MAEIHITNIAELIAFGSGSYGYGTSTEWLDVYLDNDLDFATDNDGEYKYTNWTGCIGNFYCNFYGQEHTINNISYVGTTDWGFFRSPYQVKVQDLTLKNLNVQTASVAGGIVGYANNLNINRYILIQNCHINGYIYSSGNYCGGIVGFWNLNNYQYNRTLEIRYCTVSGTVTGSYAAGIVGYQTAVNGGSWQSTVIIAGCNVRALIQGSAGSSGFVNNRPNNTTWYSYCYVYTSDFIGSFSGNGSKHATCFSAPSLQNQVYVVIKNSTGAVSCVSNTLYDADVAEEAGITISGGTPETTEHLKSREYLHNNYGWAT